MQEEEEEEEEEEDLWSPLEASPFRGGTLTLRLQRPRERRRLGGRRRPLWETVITRVSPRSLWTGTRRRAMPHATQLT